MIADNPILSDAAPKYRLRAWRVAALVTFAATLGAVALATLPFDADANKGIALLIFIGTLWLTEALHLAVTALLVPLVALALGVPGLSTSEAFSSFADPIVWLFFGGFALATALRAQQLDRKMALALLSLARGHLGVAIALMFAVTVVLSFAISNTATAALMLPLALGVLGRLDGPAEGRTRTFVLLGVAYSASLGGMGTLVASPPNAIAGRAAQIDFAEWLGIGLPLVAILVPVMVGVLWLLLRPNLHRTITFDAERIEWSTARMATLCVFAATAFGWTFGGRFLSGLGVASPDSVVAVAAAVAVMALGITTWREVSEHTDWGVLVLFGGGLTLGSVLDLSGASGALGNTVAIALDGTSPWLMFACVATFVVLLSEFTSNTAAAALMVPVFAAIAERMGMAPETLIVLVALAASCGFALPVATPPNALVFGTGHVPQREMIRNGFVLDIVCIAVLTAWALLRA